MVNHKNNSGYETPFRRRERSETNAVSRASVHCLRHYLQTSSLSIVIGGKESGRKAFRVCILKRASETSREVARRRRSSLKGICLRKINDVSDARKTDTSLTEQGRKKQLCWHVNMCIYFPLLCVSFLSIPLLFVYPTMFIYLLLLFSRSLFI